MTNNHRFPSTGSVNQSNYIGRQRVNTICTDTGWFIAEIITALIGYTDTVTSQSQFVNLTFPAVPELRKAVQ